jgi:hypothetical protein
LFVFSPFLLGIFFVKLEVSSSNYRFSMASDEKGPSCKMYLSRVLQ